MGQLKYLKVLLATAVIAFAGFAFYRWVYLPGHPKVAEFGYVLADSAPLLDSRAEIHSVVATLKSGERVEIVSRHDDWTEARGPGGERGWVETKYLMDSQGYEGGEQLLRDLKGIPVQAEGHTTFEVNLRLSPARDGQVLSRLDRNQQVEIFGRRLVARPASGDQNSSTSTAPVTDAWYLIRAESRAGWIYGRLVTLDIPPDIAPYAESYNMVAWLVLNTVDDAGRKVPQYLAADREDTQDYDFTHIRVFTWWAKMGRYATAYVESGLKGYFPIQAAHAEEGPEFRLRLVDAHGRKFQKVYKLYDTVVRPLGIVEGWASDAVPLAAERQSARRSRGRGRR